MNRIAFDLDETLGCPVIDHRGAMIGFSWRRGAHELLNQLHQSHQLVLWTVSPRRYATKALAFAPFAHLFSTLITWDELQSDPKDIRQANVAFLVDDSDHHRLAVPQSMRHRYIIVPAIGSPTDRAHPRRWIQLVNEALPPTR